MTAEDYYELEDYIRAHPDFTIPGDTYRQLLEWLSVKIPDTNATP